ncbi:NmrA family NAD(P)-binding protein, partial [Paracoccus sp. NSM]|uniref:NmrA family NAD(P)-binding protein n=1 Tax=Paracoccus sp. NSM TaxID=3457784 RepID=UPI004035C1A3
GNIASRITRQLAQHPQVTLRLTSSRPEGVAKLKASHPDADVMQADWYDVESLHRAFAGMNRVVVIPPDFVTDEETATPNVIAAAQATPGVDLIVRLLANSQAQTADEIDPEYKDVKVGSSIHSIAQSIYAKSNVPVTFVNAGAWFCNNFSWMIADDVRRHRQIRLPHDASRFWLDDDDLAAAFVKVLLEGPEKHVGQNYMLNGLGRYRFSDVAAVISAELGEPVEYVDTEDGIRDFASEQAEALITYMKHESRIWDQGKGSADF